MVKLCIFDMDGLLLDSERCMWSPSMNYAASKQGFVMDEDFHNTFRGMGLGPVGDLLRKHYGPNFDYDKFLDDMHENNKHLIEEGLPLRPGVQELLDFLKSNNIKTCIGTSTIRKETDKILSAIGKSEYFDATVCGDEIAKGKPNPEIYLTCLSKFAGIKKEEALVFEDGQSGGIASIEAGIRLVLVPDLASLSDDLKSQAFKVIDNINKIIPVIEQENSL